MNIKLDHINLTVSNLNLPWAIVAKNDSMIAMTEYKERKNAADYNEKEFHQLYHFGIRVSNLKAWEETVKNLNLKIYYGGVITFPNSQSWYVHDPNGHEIEVSYTEDKALVFPT